MTLLQLLKILKFEEDLIDKDKYILTTDVEKITLIFDSTFEEFVDMVHIVYYNKIDKTSNSMNLKQSSYMNYLNQRFAKTIRQYKIKNILENTI